MKKGSVNREEFVRRWAKKARFSQDDVNILLDSLIELFKECVENNETVVVRNFGRLSVQKLKERHVKSYTDKKGIFHPEKNLPEAERVTFKLGKGIRKS